MTLTETAIELEGVRAIRTHRLMVVVFCRHRSLRMTEEQKFIIGTVARLSIDCRYVRRLDGQHVSVFVGVRERPGD